MDRRARRKCLDRRPHRARAARSARFRAAVEESRRGLRLESRRAASRADARRDAARSRHRTPRTQDHGKSCDRHDGRAVRRGGSGARHVLGTRETLCSRRPGHGAHRLRIRRGRATSFSAHDRESRRRCRRVALLLLRRCAFGRGLLARRRRRSPLRRSEPARCRCRRIARWNAARVHRLRRRRRLAVRVDAAGAHERRSVHILAQVLPPSRQRCLHMVLSHHQGARPFRRHPSRRAAEARGHAWPQPD